jgi:asparagine synthase (glutamine-hydrolysing)
VCGIAGILGLDAAAAKSAVAGMTEQLRHRGPDDAGSAHSGPCTLGHARLSIIDLETGRQPLQNEDGSLLLVCNGEVYNFRELRKHLESRGHTFSTNSDNEVILHLYEEHGPDCLEHLDGMWAFALWDSNAERLMLARDRLGEKPLVYYQGDGFLAFASELGALLSLDNIPRVLDLAATHHYLSYLAVPYPLTIYRDIRKLPPAHRLMAENGDVSVERYWDIEPAAERWALDEAADRVRAAVEDAVRSRLVADVPIGALLSGGIDSSIVVGLMSRMCEQPVRTFSMGFDEPGYDEREHARAAAEAFGTEHREFEAKPDAVEVMPLLARRYGEPFADPSAIPAYTIARATSGHVKVALSGDGGDESFGGYPRHVAARACGQIDRVTPSFRKLIGLLGSALPRGRDRKSALRRAHMLLGAMGLSPAKRHAAWLAHASEEDKRLLYNPLVLRAASPPDSTTAFDEPYAQCRELNDAAAAAMYTDMKTYLPNDPLVKIDIASMATGLEVRAPLLDHKVVETAFRIPTSCKFRGTRGKLVLRHAFRDILPTAVAGRSKMGFGVPIAKWLRADLASFAERALLRSDTIFPRVFSTARVERLLKEHAAGRADHSYPIWTLLCFELWAREFQPKLPF